MTKYINYNLLCLFGVFAYAVKPAVAGDLSFSLSERIEYSTNVTRNNAEIDDTILNTTFNLNYDNNSEKYRTVFDGQATHQDYIDNTFGDQVNYNVSLRSNLKLINNRFEWIFLDRFRSSRVDTLLPDTPTNFEDTNYFSAGPDLYLLRNSRTSLLLSYRYEDFYFQTSNSDRVDDLVTLQLARNLARRTRVGVSVSARQSDPQEILQLNDTTSIETLDIERYDYNVFINRIGRNSNLNLQVGQSRYKSSNVITQTTGNVTSQTNTSTDTDAISYRIDFINQIAANSSMNFSYGRSLSDATDRLLNQSITVEGLGELLGGSSESNGVYVLDRLVASYKLKKGWGDLGLELNISNADYTDDTQNTDSVSSILSFGFPVSNRISYGLTYTYTTQEQPDFIPLRKFNESSIRASVSRSLDASLRMNFALSYRNRNDNDPQLSYNETMAIFEVTYRP